MQEEVVTAPLPPDPIEDLPSLPCLSRENSQCDSQTATTPLTQALPTPSDDIATESIVVPNSDTEYNAALRELRFSSYDFGQAATAPASLNTARVMKEVKSLARDLPCESTASVYVSMDRDNMSYFQTVISGTVDSPYAYGLYLFDIRLPEDYPYNPPKMTILTTGNGDVRFNPNLYADGYLCLSILNTWGSTPEEMWSPAGHSSILQVLISIQSLIMDSDVIQKEPGYEGYSTDSDENTLYRDIVRYNNMKYAMTDMIRNPPPAFAQVIHTHFSLLKTEIVKITGVWVEETLDDQPEDGEGLIASHNATTLDEFRGSGRKNCMRLAYEELVTALNSLS